MNLLANDSPKVTQILENSSLPRSGDTSNALFFGDSNMNDNSWADFSDCNLHLTRSPCSNDEWSRTQERIGNQDLQQASPTLLQKHSPSPEDQTQSPLNHLRPQLTVPSPLHEGTLEPFSGETREANFYGSHESLAAFGNQGPSAAKQTTVLQREGTPDELQDHLEGHLEMFTNTYQGLNENLNGALLVPINHATIAAGEIPFSRHNFRSINNALNKGVLLPSEFLSNDDAHANPAIFPPSHIVSEGSTSQVTPFIRLSSHGDTSQAYPSTFPLSKGVDEILSFGHPQKSLANVERGVTGSSNLDPKLMSPEDHLANTLYQNHAHKKARVSTSYGLHSSFLHKHHDQVEGNILNNSEGQPDNYVQSNKVPETKEPFIVDQPIRWSFLAQLKTIENPQESYDLASAFPLSHHRKKFWFLARSEEFKTHLVELTPAINKLHIFLKACKKSMTRVTGKVQAMIESRIERSFMSFFLMLERTVWYLAVGNLSKEGHGGEDDLSIDSLYYWWENCWNGVRTLKLNRENSITKFLQLLSKEPKPAEVLETWYTTMWFDSITAQCAAWLVIKWMEKGAPHWFKVLKEKLEPVKISDARGGNNNLAEKLVKGLQQENKLGFEVETNDSRREGKIRLEKQYQI
ncbi:hypothetical protein CROQUDRAFT_111346 [Cronartium quercuum f. sp. fusiforme G11]|uniref:Uncharacterized protein n=1 Tax=Cronartium quercuum f. sp. fusiforme G11 TaxID=708437 RepID=A0A9P6N958_9BASI|nr:hypothetical protein CROQUDRAFT_111346 [Cronartium quercuum f. sp. fusiforme G11]